MKFDQDYFNILRKEGVKPNTNQRQLAKDRIYLGKLIIV